eukprot:1638678-Rhodomonas_salina.1
MDWHRMPLADNAQQDRRPDTECVVGRGLACCRELLAQTARCSKPDAATLQRTAGHPEPVPDHILNTSTTPRIPHTAYPTPEPGSA